MSCESILYIKIMRNFSNIKILDTFVLYNKYSEKSHYFIHMTTCNLKFT